MAETTQSSTSTPADAYYIHHPSNRTCSSSLRILILALVLVWISPPLAMCQPDPNRFWPPANIEHCRVECPGQHVQMTNNRTSDTGSVFWGPQPVADFMTNREWQTGRSEKGRTKLATSLAVWPAFQTGAITTFVTAVTSPATFVPPASSTPLQWGTPTPALNASSASAAIDIRAFRPGKGQLVFVGTVLFIQLCVHLF